MRSTIIGSLFCGFLSRKATPKATSNPCVQPLKDGCKILNSNAEHASFSLTYRTFTPIKHHAMKLFALVCGFCLHSSLNAQFHKLEYFDGRTHIDSLIPGHDYYIHVDRNSTSIIYGQCNELTLELDGQSKIIFRRLTVGRDLTVQSINGGSQVYEEPNSYPNNSIYPARNITVRHFDNPSTAIVLEHISFNIAYLGSLNVHKATIDVPHINDDSTVSLIYIEINPCIDCNSINDGGKLELNVKEAAVGIILGQTKLTFLKAIQGALPNAKHLKNPDCGNCVSYRY